MIHGNKQEVLFEDVHVARPRLDPLVPPLPLTAEETQQSTRFKINVVLLLFTSTDNTLQFVPQVLQKTISTAIFRKF